MTVKSQRLFVTGGRGRLAALMADHFRDSAHAVTLFSRQQTEGFSSLKTLTDGDAVTGADVIFDLAWSSFPATAEQQPGIETQEDMPFLEKLLAALVRQPTTLRPHLVFFSSGGAVYGNAPGRPSIESDYCQPIGSYGRAKLAAEQMINAQAIQHGLSVTILRITNPYGYALPKNRAQGVVPRAIRCAEEGETLTLWGDGSARKDFLYHTDFLAALAHVIDLRPTGVFNISSGVSHSVMEVIRLVETATAKSITLQTDPAPAWDVHDSRVDPRRFSTLTGWRACVPLAEGIRRTVAHKP